MVKFGGQSLQRVARIELCRTHRGEIEGGVQRGLERPGEGAGITVPHTLQVRRSGLEKNREKMPGSWLTMSCTATRSRYRQLPHFSQYQENPSSSSGPPPPLHDDAHAPRGALRRVRNLGRKQKHLSGADRYLRHPARLNGSKHHVAFDLEEEFRTRIVVEILARIRSAHRHDDEFAVLEQELVADRRLEQLSILLDPRAQVEGRYDVHAPIIARP